MSIAAGKNWINAPDEKLRPNTTLQNQTRPPPKKKGVTKNDRPHREMEQKRSSDDKSILLNNFSHRDPKKSFTDIYRNKMGNSDQLINSMPWIDQDSRIRD